ncbi:hypothetical protein LPJ74_003382 [Coemansia sp. RSA 1843]|nr:hypothetical protein LPJ74_003382 [Coemansia sp. RSA 1843]
MAALPNYQLRTKSPSLCDSSVTQYSGYLDTSEDKHFFFWFFEARNANETAPLILWLNGGPGCSSFVGLLMEMGPCHVTPGGNDTQYNKYAWNDHAHVLFLDQPTNVGFSYGSDVFTSLIAGMDVAALLQLFYKSFPQYASSDLHVFGESYAGHYVPAVAKTIHESNNELREQRTHIADSINVDERKVLPLVSIGIGNGFVDPRTQYKYYSQMACNSTYDPVLSPEICAEMDRAYPLCESQATECYEAPRALTCMPAYLYCYRKIEEPYMNTGHNPYDVRMDCGGNSTLCYPITNDIDTYLNRKDVQKELGAEVSSFESCSGKVEYNFVLNGDPMLPLHLEIPPLLDAGIRVLIYAGDADFICNWYGNKAWTLELEWPGQERFKAASDLAWSVDGVLAGEARSASNFTFVRVFGAGHMVPYDQPKNSLDLINRWLNVMPYHSE